jgi:NADPH:quinone reductase
VIDAAGEGVDQGRVGQRVWLYMAAAGRPTGTAAEFTVVPADRAVPLPDEAGFDVGASLAVPALTAHRALTVAEDGPRRLRPGALGGAVVLAPHGADIVAEVALGANLVLDLAGVRRPQLWPSVPNTRRWISLR